MPINSETLNRQLYKRLSKYKPKPLDAEGNVTPIEDEADVFKFTFTKGGKDYGTVFATIDDNHALTVYYNDDVTESPSGSTPDIGYDDSWTGLLKQLKSWAMHNQLSWQLKDRSHLEGDMARRTHMNKKDKISEGYHAMGKSRSYSDNIPSIKIVIEHSRQIEEGEQRYRNINKIFLENQMGERFLLDTKKPGIARVYARHIAEGGKVNDERWGHIQSLCEEYQKMAGFVRATRNGQFNESAQKLVNEAINHYQGLRESLSKMTGKRGYEAYFESWTPPLMEDELEETNLNELFVQETLDPRIESVMPILSKLQKNLGEMKEVNALAEWADSLIEGEGGPEASEEEDVLTPGDAGEGGAEDAPEDDLTEDESIKSNNPVGIPESGGRTLPQDALDLIDEYIAKVEPGADRDEMIQDVLAGHIHSSELEYALQDLDEGFVGNMINKAKGMFAKPGQPAAAPAPAAPAAAPAPAQAAPGAVKKGGTMDMTKKVMPAAKPAVATAAAPAPAQSDYSPQELAQINKDIAAMNPATLAQVAARTNLDPTVTAAVKAEVARRKGVAEDLDANQKRVGQLGPTEKVKNNNIGKLVGTNENFINTDAQAVVSEMDKSEDKKGPEGKATPITPKKMADDAKKVLDKEKVKEGQEDLNAIKRLLGK
jgi:hypothetical protein